MAAAEGGETKTAVEGGEEVAGAEGEAGAGAEGEAGAGAGAEGEAGASWEGAAAGASPPAVIRPGATILGPAAWRLSRVLSRLTDDAPPARAVTATDVAAWQAAGGDGFPLVAGLKRPLVGVVGGARRGGGHRGVARPLLRRRGRGRGRRRGVGRRGGGSRRSGLRRRLGRRGVRHGPVAVSVVPDAVVTV